MINSPEHTLLFALNRTSQETELVEALQKKAFNLVVAETGEETIRVFSGNYKISLIILTNDLPGKDAFKTADEIRQYDPNVPLILLSNFVTLHSIRLALGMGYNEILQTPVSIETLEKILLKYLHN